MKNACKTLAIYIVLVICLLSSCTKPKVTVALTTQVLYTVKDTDGNVYHAIKIGNQVWLAENLKTTHYNDGSPITHITDNALWLGPNAGAYCDYNNNPAYSDTFGRLYNWLAVNNGFYLAPKGFHVATDDEWTTLTNYLGGEDVAGSHLKEAGTKHWKSPNLGSSNEVGFTALPGGTRGYFGVFRNIDSAGFWWCSIPQYDKNDSWDRYIFYNDGSIYRGEESIDFGHSVRCVKN